MEQGIQVGLCVVRSEGMEEDAPSRIEAQGILAHIGGRIEEDIDAPGGQWMASLPDAMAGLLRAQGWLCVHIGIEGIGECHVHAEWPE